MSFFLPLTSELSTTRRQSLGCPSSRTDPAGMSALEVIVAMTLLATALSVGTQIVFRARRVMDDHRDYRLALDEVSNVLDELSTLPSEELEEQLETLTLSPTIATHLVHPTLTGESDKDNFGTRITIQLAWGPSDQSPKKVMLSSWQSDRATASLSGDLLEGDEQ